MPSLKRGAVFQTMIIGDTVLVGSVELPERMPGLVETLLAGGGSDWPPLPGLADLSVTLPTSAPTPPTPSPATAEPPPFLRDLPANALAVIVLAGMLVTVMWAGVTWTRPGKPLTRQRD